MDIESSSNDPSENLIGTESPKPVDKKVPGFAQMWAFLGIFGGTAFIVTIVGSVILAAKVAAKGGDPMNMVNDPSYQWIGAFGNTLGAGVCLLIGKTWSKRPWSELLTFKSFNLLLLPILIILGIGESILLSDVDNLTRFFFPMPEFIMEIMKDLVSPTFSCFFMLVVVAPWTEELIFRGFVFNGFAKRYSPKKAVILSSLGFAIIHINPYQMISAFVVGLVLGWLRLRTKSLWPCIFLHAILNGIGFSSLFLPFDIPGYTNLEEHNFQPFWFDIIGLVLTAAGLYLLYKILENSNKRQT